MIEDDDGHARLIEKNIRRTGANNAIRHFKDGTSALGFLFGEDGPNVEALQPSLVLLDLNLPDMNGADILRTIKTDPMLRLTPVIILSTTDSKEEVRRCYDLGCNVYITKPLHYQSFSDAIRQLGLFLSIVQVPEHA
jgi:CheY-like chemotaxis protein